ncbi:MAG: SAM hydrolase/SAM-dependent halogenase family protein [Thermoleophilaceae bacterium]
MIITLLTDYGHDDDFVGVCHGVIRSISPDTPIVDITHSPHRLEPVSATFHGRDVFAPVAAALASGSDPAQAGEPIDPATLARVELPQPRTEGDTLVAHTLTVDRFGNAGLNVRREELAADLGATVEIATGGERYLATHAVAFADVKPGELILYEDAYRMLAVAINRGDAATTLGLTLDAEARLRPR